MSNNAAMGMTIQRFICEKYKIDIPDEAKAQFLSNYDPSYVSGLDKAISDVFSEIGHSPKQCVTYVASEKAKETLSPHNFILSDGSTLSVRTNKTGDKVAPRVVGQCGLPVFNAFFSDLAGYEIDDKNQIKGIVQSNIDRMLPVFLDYFFISDYTVWIRRQEDGSYSYLVFNRRQSVNIEPERELFTFTKSGAMWNESTTLKYKGVSIAEIQIHKNRTFKFRFILGALQNFLVEVKHTNETFGMTAEKAICDIFNLDYPDNFKTRCDPALQKEITPTIRNAFAELPKAVKHTGSEKGERGKESKCSYDFLLEGDRTLSVKTNTGKMVCPPEVGQPGAETCYLYFKDYIDGDCVTPESFKTMVFNHIADIMPIYVSHLFDSDYLLWVFRNGKKYDYRVFGSEYAQNVIWEKDGFSFTKPTLEDWNESNTVKYNGVTIGEFQVHRNRACYKFRFNLSNLNDLCCLQR